MSRENKNKVRFLVYPIVYGVLGFGAFYLGARPVMDLWMAKANMIFTQGSPDYTNEYEPDMEKLEINRDGTVTESEIKVPALETHYGNVICEEIGLKAPIYYGDGEESLKKGVGHYTGSGMPGEGKPILFSGHDSTYFGALENIKKGNLVEIDTNYGHFTYEVTDIKIVQATDTTAHPLESKEEQLILYTCYPFGKVTGNREERFFVYCQPKK